MTDTPEAEFAAALAAFQAELPHIRKGQTANTGSYSYDYADLTDITEAAAPLLSKRGLSFIAKPTVSETGAFVLRYALLHTSGHRETGDYPLPDPARSTPQQIGSAITYGRRYSLCAVTGIAPGGDDDDGAKATDARSRPAEPEPVTDLEWVEGWRNRLAACSSVAESRGLFAEMVQVYNSHRLTRDDRKALEAEFAERGKELQGVPA